MIVNLILIGFVAAALFAVYGLIVTMVKDDHKEEGE